METSPKKFLSQGRASLYYKLLHNCNACVKKIGPAVFFYNEMAFSEHQVHTQFEPGERVRLWKRVAIRRKAGSDEISSKLKIFNTVHVVVSRQGNNYTIRDAISGKETVAHVSQIAPGCKGPVVQHRASKKCRCSQGESASLGWATSR